MLTVFCTCSISLRYDLVSVPTQKARLPARFTSCVLFSQGSQSWCLLLNAWKELLHISHPIESLLQVGRHVQYPFTPSWPKMELHPYIHLSNSPPNQNYPYAISFISHVLSKGQKIPMSSETSLDVSYKLVIHGSEQINTHIIRSKISAGLPWWLRW